MKHGEVGVSFFTSSVEAPQREILPEDKLILLDRLYQPGDLLKRSIDDVRSGIVTKYVAYAHEYTRNGLTEAPTALMYRADLNML